jgi:hypothetical protein
VVIPTIACLGFAGWAAFEVLASVCRPRRAPLLQARPEYAARHSATVHIGASS